MIIHGIWIHDCRAQMPGQVLGPDSKMRELGHMDGDAIRLVASSQIWIDHNTLYQCQDGLLDVTLGSTDITVSNNWFRDHDKVMLLGHDDAFLQDGNMRVTVAFNQFGPNCYQRMPRYIKQVQISPLNLPQASAYLENLFLSRSAITRIH